MSNKDKIEIEYENKLVNYIFINQRIYFTFRIIAFEVYFKVCMKTIDLLGEDINFYYIIEVKRGTISEDDYNNLVCIMRNNRHDKPFKGVLIGTKRNKKVERMCIENGNIECVIIDDVIYKKNAKELTCLELDRDSSESPDAKILKRVFSIITGFDCISNWRNNDSIDIIYNYGFYRELRVKITRDNFNIAKFMKHPIFKEQWIEDKEIYIRKHYIDDFIFTDKHSHEIYNMKCRFFNDKNINDNYNEIYNVLHPLQDYIDLGEVEFDNEDNFLITNTQYLGIHIMKIKYYKPREKYIIVPNLYTYIIEKNENDIKNIPSIHDYNKINFIECCYVFIGKKLYKPEIKIDFYEEYLTIELSVKLKNRKKFKKYYDITNKKTNFNKHMYKKEFFLICNIYFILNFEKFIKEKMKKYNCKIDDYYFDSYTTSLYNHLTKNKIKKKKKKYLTLRDIIKLNGDKMEQTYEKVMQEEHERVSLFKNKNH